MGLFSLPSSSCWLLFELTQWLFIICTWRQLWIWLALTFVCLFVVLRKIKGLSLRWINVIIKNAISICILFRGIKRFFFKNNSEKYVLFSLLLTSPYVKALLNFSRLLKRCWKCFFFKSKKSNGKGKFSKNWIIQQNILYHHNSYTVHV